MNALAVSPNGLLLKRDFMAQNNIHVGDTVQVRISAYGARAETVMKVAGELDYFPTWYPDPDKPWPLMVGNLDFVFEQAGGEIPYDVWARTESGIDYAKMVSDLRSQELVVLDYDAATLRIAKEQAATRASRAIWCAFGRLFGRLPFLLCWASCSMPSSLSGGALSSWVPCAPLAFQLSR